MDKEKMLPEDKEEKTNWSDYEKFTDLRISVGIMKAAVNTLSVTCNKILDNQDKFLTRVYEDMEKNKKETDKEINYLHERLDKMSSDWSAKLESTETKIMTEIKSLRDDFIKHKEIENKIVTRIMEWKWTIVGGILVLSWLFTHLDVVKYLISK